MDVPELLDRAVALVPSDAVNEVGSTVADVREYLNYNEWEIALDLLTELGEGWPATTAWWGLLIEAAELARLTDTAAWCRWRHAESINGIIRAQLRLVPGADGGRQAPVPGKGILRPFWDIGRRTAMGEPDLQVACIWVEYVPELAPGATGSIRLGPLIPADWRDLRPGQTISMHEGIHLVGTGTITETSATH